MVRVLGRLVIQVLRFVLLCRLFAGADTSYCFDILNRVQDDGDWVDVVRVKVRRVRVKVFLP